MLSHAKKNLPFGGVTKLRLCYEKPRTIYRKGRRERKEESGMGIGGYANLDRSAPASVRQDLPLIHVDETSTAPVTAFLMLLRKAAP